LVRLLSIPDHLLSAQDHLLSAQDHLLSATCYPPVPENEMQGFQSLGPDLF
jgi:hypothetical protein